MILSATSYWFENAERGNVLTARQVLMEPHLFLLSRVKPLQILRQKALQFLIADAR